MIGACGQLGSELTTGLRKAFGNNNVIATDLRQPQIPSDGPFTTLDAMDKDAIEKLIREHRITQIYHLAAILSAKGESNPMFSWDLNMTSLLNVLNLAKDLKLDKVYWPSSIAVFGPTTPREFTPQNTIMDPNTVYGISKLAGERWCSYFHEKYGVDVRSLRYPGLIGYKSPPGGGTTDYAVDVFFKAAKNEPFESFLSKDTTLPMMYMDDAVKATIDLMQAPADKVKIRSSYNISSMSFTPQEVVESIRKVKPDFVATYEPDFRQAIADSWPKSIDDSKARKDWGWQHSFDLEKLTEEMLENLS